jgi:hypothetical protein
MIVSALKPKQERCLTITQADFIFFMTIASICFSGLLFTLWELAKLEPGNKWSVTSIAWLMTQIWFGKYLSSLALRSNDSSILL